MKCLDCGAEVQGESWEHLCREADLPRALVREDKWTIRETEGMGRGLWRSTYDAGVKVAYWVGGIGGPADRDTLLYCIDEAEEEMRSLMAEGL